MSILVDSSPWRKQAHRPFLRRALLAASVTNIAEYGSRYRLRALFKCSAGHEPAQSAEIASLRSLRLDSDSDILDGTAHMCTVRESQSHAKASKNRTADLSRLFLLYL